ncbi:hypothetical protein CROQUDRAFT_131365 [Cronartium quercuum f. sp. fusiforme G11]|uniref:Uncharacterized protein n=1 Tax=Cronartium quercuum f. sp. fusiforme G11 TaxID=708437 RepID=A0A9P6NPC7_9BASI|nr:hypothetical protein CROQUDRAFT_131365 [Cronartium quercuum f. sp. fusiforme G11]
MAETFKPSVTSNYPWPSDQDDKDRGLILTRVLALSFGCLAVVAVISLTIILIMCVKKGYLQSDLTRNTQTSKRENCRMDSVSLNGAELGKVISIIEDSAEHEEESSAAQFPSFASNNINIPERPLRVSNPHGSGQQHPGKNAGAHHMNGSVYTHHSFSLNPLHFSAFTVRFPSIFDGNKKSAPPKRPETSSSFGNQVWEEPNDVSDVVRPNYSSSVLKSQDGQTRLSHLNEKNTCQDIESLRISSQHFNRRTTDPKPAIDTRVSTETSISKSEADIKLQEGNMNNLVQVPEAIAKNENRSKFKKSIIRFMGLFKSQDVENKQDTDLDFLHGNAEIHTYKRNLLRAKRISSTTIPTAHKVSAWAKGIEERAGEVNKFQGESRRGSRFSFKGTDLTSCDDGNLGIVPTVILSETSSTKGQSQSDTKIHEGSIEKYTYNPPRNSLASATPETRLTAQSSLHSGDLTCSLDNPKISAPEASSNMSSTASHENSGNSLWEKSTDTQTASSAPDTSVQDLPRAEAEPGRIFSTRIDLKRDEPPTSSSSHLDQSPATQQESSTHQIQEELVTSTDSLIATTKDGKKIEFPKVPYTLSKTPKDDVLQMNSLVIPAMNVPVYTAEISPFLSDSPVEISNDDSMATALCNKPTSTSASVLETSSAQTQIPEKKKK